MRVYKTSVKNDIGETVIHCRMAVNAVYIQHILDVEAKWVIKSDGNLEVAIHALRNTKLPFLPRFGLRLFLPKEYDRVTYTGFGPYESYIDKHQASRFGRYTALVEDMYVDYIHPQDHGSRYGCESVILTSRTLGQLIFTSPKPFSFQALNYTQEELEARKHNFELTKTDATVLCLDYKTSGVGSCYVGPPLAEKYQLNEENIEFYLNCSIQ